MSKARTTLPFEYPVEARTGLEAHVRSHAETARLPSGCRDSARRGAKFPAPRLRRPARNRACGSSGSAACGDDARRCWRTRSLCASSSRLLSSECKRLHDSLLQKKRVEQGFREFFKDDEQSGSHDSVRIVCRRCSRFYWRRGHFSADCRSVGTANLAA
jgi:hypothetical protein